MGAGSAPGRFRSLLSRISTRLFAFNILIVFLPIAGFLSLGTYERQLLASLEGALVQQGRVLASALEDSGPSLDREASRIIIRLRQRHDARVRVVDIAGKLLADSSRLAPASGRESAGGRAGESPPARAAQETFLYRLASLPVRLSRRVLRAPVPPADSDEYYAGSDTLSGAEVLDALAGQYGAATRVSRGQQSVTLYSAIPIFGSARVIGAVVVSQSTYRILSDLYALRLDIFRLFLWSIATSAMLSLLLSATITAPLRRLRDRAQGILDARGRLTGRLAPLARRDEIGDLSRSLEALTERLARHVRLVESFASDVSHELKNPLASIRSAVELAQGEPDAGEQRELLAMALSDVNRMERLLDGVRDISRIDSGDGGGEAGGAAPETTADVCQIAERVLEAFRMRMDGGRVRFSLLGRSVPAAVTPQRIQQLIENLVDNAAGFTREGGRVLVEVRSEGPMTLLRVSDEGPGIPAEHAERIFDRFFSFRPGEDRARHAGLGLAIVKSIATGHGGSVRAFNLPERGACFEVRVPRA
ncbi:MAG TPA: ATP-binding protein [Spirochaetia bacterium]|nr:ATP-binding protein [Spirochaetia bacterium]